MVFMGKQGRYSPEVRERAVRLVFEQQGEYESQWAAIVSVSEKIGCTSETLRKWVRAAERQQIPEQRALDAERERVKALERENRELRQANEILRKAAVDSTCQCNMSQEVLHGEDGPAGDARRAEARVVGSLARWGVDQPDLGGAGETAGFGVHGPAALRWHRSSAAQAPAGVPVAG